MKLPLPVSVDFGAHCLADSDLFCRQRGRGTLSFESADVQCATFTLAVEFFVPLPDSVSPTLFVESCQTVLAKPVKHPHSSSSSSWSDSETDLSSSSNAFADSLHENGLWSPVDAIMIHNIKCHLVPATSDGDVSTVYQFRFSVSRFAPFFATALSTEDMVTLYRFKISGDKCCSWSSRDFSFIQELFGPISNVRSVDLDLQLPSCSVCLDTGSTLVLSAPQSPAFPSSTYQNGTSFSVSPRVVLKPRPRYAFPSPRLVALYFGVRKLPL
eukprot:ANDGO_00021.mRNA.1 hypothetical protein